MVVCKFFLQGTCKFGNSCKFEHSMSDPYHYVNPNSASILRQPSAPAATPNIDTNTLVKSVVNEAIAAEKGAQWLLSCYAPFKEKPNFPGLEDTSFEEVRWGFYEARENGTLDQYTRQVQEMMQTRIMQLKALQNPSPDIINLLKTIYDTPPSSSFSSSSMQIAAVNRKGGFANSGGSTFVSPLKSSFPQQSSSATPFGGFNQPLASNAGFSQSNSSVFGGTQQSIFGGQQTSQNFASQPANTSIFAGAGQPQNASPFGQQAMFASQQASPFGAAPQTNVFAGGAQPNAPNTPFLAAQKPQMFAQPSIFGEPQQAPANAFPSNQGGSIFGGAPPNQPMFAAAPQTQASPFGAPQQQSVFGQVPQQTQGGLFKTGFGASNPVIEVDMTVYSRIEDLTSEEMNWFQSDSLDVAGIPEKPPTYEMCHK